MLEANIKFILRQRTKKSKDKNRETGWTQLAFLCHHSLLCLCLGCTEVSNMWDNILTLFKKQDGDSHWDYVWTFRIYLRSTLGHQTIPKLSWVG